MITDCTEIIKQQADPKTPPDFAEYARLRLLARDAQKGLVYAETFGPARPGLNGDAPRPAQHAQLMRIALPIPPR